MVPYITAARWPFYSMHEVSIALSLLCIFFYVAREQIRLYHADPLPAWHSPVSTVPAAGSHLVVTPGFSFGRLGQPISVTSLGT